jgi:hypothetical protein
MPALTSDADVVQPVVSAGPASGATAVPLEESTTRFRMRNNGPNDAFWRTTTGVTTGNGYLLANGEETQPFGKNAAQALSLFFVTAAAESATIQIVEER